MLRSCTFPVYFAILPSNAILLSKFVIFCIYFSYNGLKRTLTKKQFCTRCLKNFMEQKSLQQHLLYCTNKFEPDNIINALRVTGVYSKEVRKANIKRMRQYLQRLEEEGATI